MTLDELADILGSRWQRTSHGDEDYLHRNKKVDLWLTVDGEDLVLVVEPAHGIGVSIYATPRGGPEAVAKAIDSWSDDPQDATSLIAELSAMAEVTTRKS